MGEKIRQFILLSGDAALLHLALFLALCVRYRALIDDRIWSQHFYQFAGNELSRDGVAVGNFFIEVAD